MLKELARNFGSLNERRELLWLEQKMEQGRKAPFSEIITITPTMARHILEKNAGNRHVHAKLVRQIATDIRNGLWQLNGESIIIAGDGTLNDGQHRLNAIIESETPVQSLVMFGVSRESRTTVDMGTARTAGDILAMNGGEYCNHSAAVTKLLLGYRMGFYTFGSNRSDAITKQVIIDYYYNHEKEINSALQAVIHEKFFRRHNTTVWAVAYAILAKVNEIEAGVFFARAATGENLRNGDAILTMRTHFEESHGSRMLPWERLELILRYWNAWRRRKITNRKIALQGRYPDLEF